MVKISRYKNIYEIGIPKDITKIEGVIFSPFRLTKHSENGIKFLKETTKGSIFTLAELKAMVELLESDKYD